eukprot:CAMPEP_0202719308 /NCGR_PEP_ID=MMETSP1385-20130828/130093_1 /ASSEMBLY_ACC=CAM_ASM_000861 /TAXON_ID=933848 /ORGANISM="Elphidium margaritaceum" /LENGTH=75 /DNA_ID=CAMNT_0049382447 /DNA_START=1 /DNA_END=224 /DNA_ORIENTATION=+
MLQDMDNCLIKKQNDLLQLVKKANNVTLEQIIGIKQSFLTFMNETGPYQTTLQGLQDAHLHNISLNERAHPAAGR